jgi:hypothetical protein
MEIVVPFPTSRKKIPLRKTPETRSSDWSRKANSAFYPFKILFFALKLRNLGDLNLV